MRPSGEYSKLDEDGLREYHRERLRAFRKAHPTYMKKYMRKWRKTEVMVCPTCGKAIEVRPKTDKGERK